MKITQRKIIQVRTGGEIFKVVLQVWDEEKGYVVRVPRFPEIVTEGANLVEAKRMAKEAIEICLECQENEYHPRLKSKRDFQLAPAARV